MNRTGTGSSLNGPAGGLNYSVETGRGPIDFLPLNSRVIYEDCEDVVFVISMLLNGMLAVVLLTERSETLRAYTRVLMQNCVCDIIYSIVSVTTKLKCEFYNGQLAMLIHGIYSNMSYNWHIVGLAAYVFSVYLSMFVIPVVFYFRYKIVVHNVYLTERQLVRILIALIVFVAATAVFLTSAVYDYGEDREAKCLEIFAHPLWTYGGARIDNCLISNANNPMLMAYYVSLGSANIASYVIMIYCTRAVFAALADARPNLRSKTAQLQAQMNMLLLVQLFTPIFCASLPLTLAVVACTLRLMFPGLSLFVVFGFMWIPLINPVITIALVSNYRRRCLRLIMMPWRALRRQRVGSNNDTLTTSGVGDKQQESSEAWARRHGKNAY